MRLREISEMDIEHLASCNFCVKKAVFIFEGNGFRLRVCRFCMREIAKLIKGR